MSSTNVQVGDMQLIVRGFPVENVSANYSFWMGEIMLFVTIFLQNVPYRTSTTPTTETRSGSASATTATTELLDLLGTSNPPWIFLSENQNIQSADWVRRPASIQHIGEYKHYIVAQEALYHLVVQVLPFNPQCNNVRTLSLSWTAGMYRFTALYEALCAEFRGAEFRSAAKQAARSARTRLQQLKCVKIADIPDFLSSFNECIATIHANLGTCTDAEQKDVLRYAISESIVPYDSWLSVPVLAADNIRAIRHYLTERHTYWELARTTTARVANTKDGNKKTKCAICDTYHTGECRYKREQGSYQHPPKRARTDFGRGNGRGTGRGNARGGGRARNDGRGRGQGRGGYQQQRQNQNEYNNNNQRRCYRCGRLGHYQSECRSTLFPS